MLGLLMQNKKISKLTGSELKEIENFTFNEHSLFDLSLTEIAKKLLSNLLELNIYESSFENVRASYVESSNHEDVSSEEITFHKEICKRYLYIKFEPRKKLLELFSKARLDIKKINSQLAYINSEELKLSDTKKEKGRLTGEERYYRNQLDCYKQKNILAKTEIIDFLTDDIESYALNECKEILGINFNFTKLFTGEMPYRYSYGHFFKNIINEFDVRSLNNISNKFLDLPFGSHKKIEKLYLNDKKEFYILAKEYIQGELPDFENAFVKINGYIKSNHIINRRAEVLTTILEHYKNKDFLSVVNMLPLQIEGIFHDICLAVGINESRLDIASINEKLRIIQSSFDHFIYFEYFSFKFPVIRNMVAHGQLIEDNHEHTAIMLILDLLPVCEFSTSTKIPVNNKIKLIKEANNQNFNSLIKLLDFIEVEIPVFYRLEEQYISGIALYRSEEFWNYIESELANEKIEEINKSIILKFIGKLKTSRLAEEKCEYFFQNLSKYIEERTKEAINRKKRVEDFLKLLKSNK